MKNIHQKSNEMNKKHIFIFLLVIISLIILLVQFPILNTDATCFDDEMYLKENILVKNPSIDTAKTFLKEVLEPSDFRGYYQPLSMISLMIDYKIAKTDKDLYVYHRTSLILHLLNTILIAIILFIIFKNPYAAVITALIFGIHPMTVETIAWVGERKTTLASFFAFISILVYVLYTKKPKWYLHIICAVMIILSLLSKPIGLMLPLILLLMDFWPLERIDFKNFKQRILEKIPLFLISFVFGIVTYLSQKNTGYATITIVQSFASSLYKVFYQIVFYILQMIFPYNLTAHYPVPDPLSISNWRVFAGVFGTLAILTLAIVSLKKSKSFFTGWFIFLILIFPTLGVISITELIKCDKYAYFPSFGFLLLITAVISHLWSKKHINIVAIQTTIVIGAILVTGVYSNITRNYIKKWSDTETYYKHMISLAPTATRLYTHIGRVFYENGNIDDAIKYIKKSIDIFPNDSDLYGDLGNAYASKGDLVSTVENFQKSVALNPNNYKSHFALGDYLNQKNEYSGAIKSFEKAIELYPLQDKKIQKNFNHQVCYYGLALAQFQTNKQKEAFDNIQKAIQINPNYFDPYFLLGNYYNAIGDYNKAIQTFQSAKKIAVNDFETAKTYFGEGISRRNMNQLEAAILALNNSINKNPKFVGARIELSNVYLAKKMNAEALSLTEKSISEFVNEVDLSILYNNWGYILAIQNDLLGAIAKFEKSLQLNPNFIGAQKNLEHLRSLGAK